MTPAEILGAIQRGIAAARPPSDMDRDDIAHDLFMKLFDRFDKAEILFAAARNDTKDLIKSKRRSDNNIRRFMAEVESEQRLIGYRPTNTITDPFVLRPLGELAEAHTAWESRRQRGLNSMERLTCKCRRILARTPIEDGYPMGVR